MNAVGAGPGYLMLQGENLGALGSPLRAEARCVPPHGVVAANHARVTRTPQTRLGLIRTRCVGLDPEGAARWLECTRTLER